jgi:hypothetical protein
MDRLQLTQNNKLDLYNILDFNTMPFIVKK